MLKEIENFTLSLDEDIFIPTALRDEGLFVSIDLDKDGYPDVDSYESRVCTKKEMDDDFISTHALILKEYLSDCIDANKYIDTGGKDFKKIHSSIPFALWFKCENIDSIKSRLPFYFNNCEAINTESHDIVSLTKNIFEFSKKNIPALIKSDIKFKFLEKGKYVKIFFNCTIVNYKSAYQNYLSKYLFNKEDQGKAMGTTIFFAGAPDKKPYLVPQTSFLKSFYRVSINTAQNLDRFRKLLASKPKRKLPNPLPIFIDHEELNNQVVRIFNEKEESVSFRNILEQLHDNRNIDLGNYYLVNWTNTKDGLVLRDFDYVERFKYFLDDFYVDDILSLDNKSPRINLDTIFAFESVVINKIFNNALVVKTKNDGILFKYFDDIDTKYTTSVGHQNILKYGKGIYDFIYKSSAHAFTGDTLFDIIITDILHAIRTNTTADHEYQIKEKLNILFSLYHKLENTNKLTGGALMPTIIPVLQDTTRKIINNDNVNLSNDDEFAFITGQLIYYLLSKSESSNKTHALLEPFISKTDPDLLKMTITRTLNKYKHALDFGSKRFERAASQVLGYNCTKSISSLLPIILAGYFGSSLFYEKNTTNQ